MYARPSVIKGDDPGETARQCNPDMHRLAGNRGFIDAVAARTAASKFAAEIMFAGQPAQPVVQTVRKKNRYSFCSPGVEVDRGASFAVFAFPCHRWDFD